MLTAVLERRIGLPLGQQDVYVNVVGGARILEPAADLAVMLAIISAYQERPVPSNMVAFGEVGLTGEIRPVGQPEARAREALNMGFTQLLLPRHNHARVQEAKLAATLAPDSKVKVQCKAVRNMAEAAQALLTRIYSTIYYWLLPASPWCSHCGVVSCGRLSP
ncbi:MAG: magnesium chelatase domain-containing protein [Mariprofundaceae bacterium]|nr:magnesium chelatase domain-containing protein [Mariprofundaceae bacterium]